MSTAKKQIKQDTVEEKKAKIRRVHARAPRAKITPFNHIRLEIQAGKKNIPVKLINISTTGIGFELPKSAAVPAAGSTIDGQLVFTDSKKAFPASLNIHQVNGRILGCSFTNTDSLLMVNIAHYFDVELSALEVIKLRANQSTHPKEGKNHSFEGRDQCSLYFINNDENEVTYFKVMVFGNLMEWTKGSEGAMILTEGKKDEDLRRLFMKFVLNIQTLEDQYTTQIIELIQTLK